MIIPVLDLKPIIVLYSWKDFMHIEMNCTYCKLKATLYQCLHWAMESCILLIYYKPLQAKNRTTHQCSKEAYLYIVTPTLLNSSPLLKYKKISKATTQAIDCLVDLCFHPWAQKLQKLNNIKGKDLIVHTCNSGALSSWH